MPSFAAVMAAGWMAWGWLWIKRGRGLWGVPVLLVLLCVWVVSELGSVGTFRDSARVLTWRQVAERRHVDVGPAELPASGVYVSPEDAANTGIPYNGAGWDAPSGMVMPCVIVFVDDPEFIEVEVIPLSQEARRNGPVALRAKIGLEYLSRESMKPSKKGWVVRFAGPRSQRYKTGLQVVFLATVPNTCIGEPRTSWRLLRLRWRDTTKEA